MSIEKDAKLIFSPQLANYLLRSGFDIVKIKKKRNSEDEVVFVFRLQDNIQDVIDEWRQGPAPVEHTNKKDKDAKLIFNPSLANYLLNRGYFIIKLKPNRNNPSTPVFVFRLDDDLLETMEDWNNLPDSKKTI